MLKIKKLFEKHKFVIVLSSIIFLAALLRFPFLSKFPPSMLQDEVGIGYSAISIAETGKDEWGYSFPLIFKSFGDYKAPLHIYTIALLYKLIGWHEVLPRIAAAIQGLIIVLTGTLWIRKIFKSNKLGLISGFVLAISPWTIHLSRLGFESNYGLALFMTGLLFLSYASESKHKLVLSGIFFGLSTYSYHSYRFFILLFLLSVIFGNIVLNFKNWKNRLPYLKNVLLILIISTLISLPGLFDKNVAGRLEQTLIIKTDDYEKLYEHYENDCHGTMIELNPKLVTLCKLKYNKFTRKILIASDSYVKYLSPQFLFFTGDHEISRNPTKSGEFYLILFPLWVIGALLLFKEYKEQFILIAGYFVAMLPSALSGPPHAVRLTTIIPFVIATIVLGYDFLEKYFKKFRYFLPTLVILLFVSLGWFLMNYTIDTFAANEITSTYLSYAKKAAILEGEYIKKGYTVYADHDLYPEPHMYYAYYNQIDPKITQQSFAQVYKESAGFSRPKQFGEKMIFDKGDFEAFNCNDAKINPAAFLTNDALKNVTPIKIIQDNTHLYNFIYVYESSQKCSH